MTIKQQGGVFGRNPTFNDVEVADLQATNIDLPDNGRLRIGTGDDLQMYHNGNHSYILDAGAGDLKILGQNVEIGALDGTLGFKAISNSFATLYFNNASRARTTSAGFEITSGNLIVPSGNGIDFSATAGTGTSELFDDYEEGTWTPTTAGDATGVIGANNAGFYVKTGRLVHVQCQFVVTTNFTSNAVGGLPYQPYIQSTISSAYGIEPVLTIGSTVYSFVTDTSTNILFVSNTNGTPHNPSTTGNIYRVQFTYVAAE